MASEDQLANHVRSFVESSRSHPARIANETIWMTNIAAMCGFSGYTWNAQLSTFLPANDPYRYGMRNKIFINKILPTLQNRLARLCKSPPRFDVRPESNSSEDRDNARLALDTLTSLWEQLNVNQRRIALKMWVQQCGHAWMRVGWDPTKGKKLTDPVTGETTYEGAPFVEEMPPFEVFPPPNAKSEEEALSIGIATAKVRPLEYFRSRFPRGHEVKEESAWLMSLQYESRINNMTSKAGFAATSGGGSEMLKNAAIELVKYEAPTQERPEGRMITVASGIVLEDKPLPIGEIPFKKFDDIPVAGKFYSESVVTHLRPISDQYNEVIARRSEWVRKMLAGKWVVPRGAGLTQESIDDTNGEVIEYDVVPNAPGGGQPTPSPIPTIPAYAYNEEDALNAMFADVSGLQEVSQGKAPSATMPAIGMQLLQEQDETRIGIMIDMDEAGLAKIGSFLLKYFEKFATTPRKFKLAGKMGNYMVKEVAGDMLQGNTDVVVIRGSTYPGSKTLKRNDIMNLYGSGLLGDPNDPKVKERVLSDMEYGDISSIWLDQSLIAAQIKRMINKLKAGEPVEVSEFDNHAAMLEELNRERLGEPAEENPEYMAAVVDLMKQIVDYQVQQQAQASGQVDPNQLPPELQSAPQPPPPPPIEGEQLPL